MLEQIGTAWYKSMCQGYITRGAPLRGYCTVPSTPAACDGEAIPTCLSPLDSPGVRCGVSVGHRLSQLFVSRRYIRAITQGAVTKGGKPTEMDVND